MNADRPKRDVKKQPVRRPYQKPRLVRWGNLSEITQGGGGKRAEPSKARTRF